MSFAGQMMSYKLTKIQGNSIVSSDVGQFEMPLLRWKVSYGIWLSYSMKEAQWLGSH
jgi:hypothetical protein